jgi:hypothetical protein
MVAGREPIAESFGGDVRGFDSSPARFKRDFYSHGGPRPTRLEISIGKESRRSHRDRSCPETLGKLVAGEIEMMSVIDDETIPKMDKKVKYTIPA